MDIDSVINDVESGKTSPKDGARKIHHSNWHCEHSFNHSSKPKLFGTYLIVQGILILGHLVFGWFPIEYLGSWWNLVWPTILGMMGISMLIKAGSKGKFSFLGIVLFALGATRMIVNTGLIGMVDWWNWFWPACLIIAGIAILLRGIRRRNGNHIHFDWEEFDWND